MYCSPGFMLNRKQRADERGAAAVEFAILYNQKQGLHAGAREGARYASLPQKTVADVESYVEDALEGSVDTSDPSFSVTVKRGNTTVTNGSACSGHAGTTVTVIASVDATVDVPLFPVSTGTLTGEGDFRCE